jgi:hypothetical protein
MQTVLHFSAMRYVFQLQAPCHILFCFCQHGSLDRNLASSSHYCEVVQACEHITVWPPSGPEETAAKRKHVEPDSPVQLEPEIAEPVPEVRATEGDAATVTQSTAVVELQQRTVYPSEGILSSTKFESLEICEKLSKAIQSMGHEYLTHIQDAAIPQLLKGHDLLGAARTGAPLQLSLKSLTVINAYTSAHLPRLLRMRLRKEIRTGERNGCVGVHRVRENAGLPDPRSRTSL